MTPGRSAPGTSGTRSYEPVAATIAPARISRWASSAIALTSPSYQPMAATPVRTSTPAASAVAASSSSVPIASPEPAPRPCQPAPIPGLRLDDRDAEPRLRPHPALRGARRARRRRRGRRCRCAGRPAGAVTRRPALQRQPTASAEPAQHVEIALAQPARSQETVVVERRRDPARHEPDERQQVALDGWPGVLAARDQALAHRHAARSDARHAVDLAFAPAALAGRAHQPARSMEAEAARQRQPVGGQEAHRERLALDALVGVPVEREPDEPLCRGAIAAGHSSSRHLSAGGRSASCRCRRASTRGRRRGLPSRARGRCRSA